MPASDESEASAARRGTGPARGPSARAYLLILLGDYTLDEDDGAWTHTVVEALGLVGFEETAARQALTRSAAAGLLAPRRVGRRTRWRLTPAGREALTAAKERLFAAGPERDWNGDWLIMLANRAGKSSQPPPPAADVVGLGRFRLARFGCVAQPASLACRGSAPGPRVAGRLGARHAPARPSGRTPTNANAWSSRRGTWPTSTRCTGRSLDRFTPVRPDSPGSALAELAHLLYQWRRLLLADPGLPPSLLPARWSGEQARRLLLDRHPRWQRMARAWWHAHEATESASTNGGRSADS